MQEPKGLDVQLLRIDARSPLYLQSVSLLHSAFCADERRDDDELTKMVNSVVIFGFNAIMVNGEWAGLLTVWNFGRFMYVEHFAVIDALRGRGVGAQVLAKLKEVSGVPIILEVELPGSSADADRRIAFYERAGFRLQEMDYVQPPYAIGKKEVPMRLMSIGFDERSISLDDVVSSIRKHVYRVKE